ncbi:hypothetical protein Sjap_005484 [Stephania japonica]
MGRATVAILAFMVLFVTINTNRAVATHMVVYQGQYYSGATQVIGACGCTNIKYHGSYKYFAEGQSTRLYNQGNCHGPTHTVLPSNQNSERNIGFGWQSAFIVC